MNLVTVQKILGWIGGAMLIASAVLETAAVIGCLSGGRFFEVASKYHLGVLPLFLFMALLALCRNDGGA